MESNTLYSYHIYHTAKDTYYCQLFKHGVGVVYVSKEHSEAENAAKEARLWLHPEAYSPPPPDRVTLGNVATKLFRVLAGLPSDPTYVSKEFRE